MDKGKIVHLSTELPAPADEVWDRLLRVETLRYITRPLLSFAPANHAAAQGRWRENARFHFTLRVFGAISFGGVHSIEVQTLDKAGYEIYTKEQNRVVHTWNHRIRLEPLPGGRTRYTDTVALCAGRLTPAVAAWARGFYRHRQKRWRRLLRQASAPGKGVLP